MHKRPLGNTGLSVSEIGFGAWAIGGSGYGPVPRDDAEAAVNAYLEAGGNFIDTARGYADSEEILGDLLDSPSKRDAVVIATKSGKHDLPGIRADLETSLRLLKTDRVEVLQLHGPRPAPDERDEELDAVNTLVKEGLVRFAGASIRGSEVTDATVAQHRDYAATGKCRVIQLIYSIFRQKNAEAFEDLSTAGVGIIARTALESGFLTGKYRPGHQFDDHRNRWGGARLEKLLRRAEEVRDLAAAWGYRSPAELALRFALRPTAVSTVIVSAKNAQQCRQNLAAAEAPALSDAQADELERRFSGFTPEANTGE